MLVFIHNSPIQYVSLASGNPYIGPIMYHNLLKQTSLVVILCQDLLANLDVLVFCVLLAHTSLDKLLPLVVLGLALRLRVSFPCILYKLCKPMALVCRSDDSGGRGIRVCIFGRRRLRLQRKAGRTYSKIEHARLSSRTKVLSLCNLCVSVQLFHKVYS